MYIIREGNIKINDDVRQALRVLKVHSSVFAEIDTDCAMKIVNILTTCYEACVKAADLQGKIDLDDPDNLRFILKYRDMFYDARDKYIISYLSQKYKLSAGELRRSEISPGDLMKRCMFFLEGNLWVDKVNKKIANPNTKPTVIKDDDGVGLDERTIHPDKARLEIRDYLRDIVNISRGLAGVNIDWKVIPFNDLALAAVSKYAEIVLQKINDGKRLFKSNDFSYFIEEAIQDVNKAFHMHSSTTPQERSELNKCVPEMQKIAMNYM